MPSSYVLGAHYEKFVKDQVASGRYNNASEVLRDALRHFEDWMRLRPMGLDEIREAIALSDNSGPGQPADVVFDNIRDMLAEDEANKPLEPSHRSAA